jgi:hypothetical protein
VGLLRAYAGDPDDAVFVDGVRGSEAGGGVADGSGRSLCIGRGRVGTREQAVSEGVDEGQR